MNLQEILALPHLAVRARAVVEGFLTGIHRSPYHGFSVQFSEHRPYTPGDDIRFLDWKVYARRERLYVKRFEEETNLRAYILLDASGSMALGTKWTYAQTLAAALAYLLHLQRDAVALWTFGALPLRLPPRTSRHHLQRIFGLLERLRPQGETRLDSVQTRISAMHRRSMVIWITDGMVPPDHLLETVRLIRTDRRDVMVFLILDTQEIAFPFRGSVRFVDLETPESVEGDAETLSSLYRERLTRHLERLREGLLGMGVDHMRLTTETSLISGLLAVLHHRRRGY